MCCALYSIKHFNLTVLACFAAWVTDGFSPECIECFVEPLERCVNLITEFCCMFSFLQRSHIYSQAVLNGPVCKIEYPFMEIDYNNIFVFIRYSVVPVAVQSH